MSIWDALEKAAYTGVGLAALTKEKLDEVVDTLKRERGLTEEEGRHLAEEIKERAEMARRNLETRIDAAVRKAYRKMKLVSADDLKKLIQRVEKLEKKVAGKTGETVD